MVSELTGPSGKQHYQLQYRSVCCYFAFSLRDPLIPKVTEVSTFPSPATVRWSHLFVMQLDSFVISSGDPHLLNDSLTFAYIKLHTVSGF